MASTVSEHIMKRLINILILLIIPIFGCANGRLAVDRLIWNGDTLRVFVFSNPSELLDLRNDIDSLRSKLFGDTEAELNTASWREYIAEWTIIENEMYLTNIFSLNYYHDSIKSDLKTVFGAEYENGKVKATWITEQILIPKGKLIHYVDREHQFYKTELVLTFKNGKLIEQMEYDNSKSLKSIFTENQDSLQNFIYTNIDWKKVPDLKNEEERVFITITSGATSKPGSVYLVKGSDHEILNQEALRVVNLIPEWDVYYRRGKFYRIAWSVPIIFDEQKRMKYAKIKE
jgi:hypothetical protein